MDEEVKKLLSEDNEKEKIQKDAALICHTGSYIKEELAILSYRIKQLKDLAEKSNMKRTEGTLKTLEKSFSLATFSVEKDVLNLLERVHE